MIAKFFRQVRLTWQLIRDGRVSLWAKLIPFFVLAYVVSPFDLVPDWLLLVGQIDDLGIILAGMRLFEMVSPGYVVEAYKPPLQPPNPEDVIEGEYRVLQPETDEH